ncbi:MAG: hypothetical protein CHACPFDD_01352 [Phycisphaerae bacterium]|nr:hypothetical protein [Phycisphaerae bacterium]
MLSRAAQRLFFSTLCASAFAPQTWSFDIGDPWADRVVAYHGGVNPTLPYTDPLTSVGSPERFTGEGVFPSVVSVYSGAYGVDEIVSVGEGGWLTVAFDEPITDDPSHAYGVDLIVFGNGFLFDSDGDDLADSAFDEGPFSISVSDDNVVYHTLGVDFNDAVFPVQGYNDSGPFDPVPGNSPSDFLKPINPALGLSDLFGLSYAQIVALYDGSGGGIPVDIAASGLSAVNYVRIDVPTDDLRDVSPEIDAFAAVPEPSSVVFTLAAGFVLRRRGAR